MQSIKRSIAYTALLGAVVLAGGCETSEAKPSAGVPTAGGAEKELRQVSKETKEAVQATKDYAYAVRDEFVKDMQGELDTINRVLQQLSDKVERSNGAAKADAKAKLVAVRDRLVQLNGELVKARNVREAAWVQVKAGFQKSHDELKESVNQTRTWLSEKIAP